MKRKRPTDERLAADDERREWARAFPRCWACGSGTIVDTHEIIRRSETAEALHVCNYVRLCRACHEEAHGGAITKGMLLTLKLLFDGARYDPDWIRAHGIKRHWEAMPLPLKYWRGLREII